ncbi:enoyl-CoA hydratase [Mycobacterium sp. CBMA293]|uniref:enoyl-CoA hydratase/isomerase family protein n=1 Tax=unclassified Mycolicibacterium TaxID=2636767 RepID=UPI0012DE9513|nr:MULTISPECIES: enoyl-CoA hydratase-related protein [unclassified Mycolicibacterium]MUL47160.1 enoyl-CoA hydratase [Mycolicibacterium sp. CBMA 360]MUL61269.1 enoyl-CoA hydratase [Mycolicibacterium sp. CBMA 335]MUL72004.1 enoyl-CoA hydratase [Mycolicibacterium sp. CBMA 311]MUL96171.1 enoyl-CoA hydratase [Mycolicibacterium sp. CBMA 230]MUM06701.1 enoyl-CoA hydratase [Mycolicibacterium sp. CBMA 213]
MTTTEQTTAETPVLIERDGAVAIVTINRPKRRNALTNSLKVALVEALNELGTDVTVRAVVVTGAGGHFCAGQDLAEHATILAARPEHAFDTVALHYSPIVTALATMPKPVIAAIEGTCVGAGLGFALAADLRVVSHDATFATAFSSIGLTCDSGLAHTLPRAVGDARARELILLAQPFTAEKANEFGLVTRLTPPGNALVEAIELAATLSTGPTRAYAESKGLLARSYFQALDQTLDQEGLAQRRLGATTDHKTAVNAFLAKEKPAFIGQ